MEHFTVTHHDAPIGSVLRVAIVALLLTGCATTDTPSTTDRTATLVREQALQPDGAPPLTTISRVAATDAHVYVGQQGEQHILQYTANGTFIGTVGRTGGGPGELRDLARFGVVGDTLWAIDWGARRVTHFAINGAVLNDVALEPSVSGDDPTVSPYYLLPEAVARDGSILGWGGTVARLLADGTVTKTPIVRFAVRGNRRDTLGWHDMTHYGLMLRGKNGGGVYWSQPVETNTFAVYDGAHDKVCVVHRDRWAREQSATIGVTCLGTTGDTVWQRAIAYEPVPIPAQLRDSLRDSRVRPLRREFSAAEVDAALYIPTHWPPVTDGMAGADGSLWLRGPALDGRTTYVVLSAAGDVTTRITVPETQRVLWADRSTAWVQELDADDVPTLTRFAVQPALPR